MSEKTTWRKEPPTVEEIKVCRYWWRRQAAPTFALPVLRDLFFDVSSGEIMIDVGDSLYKLEPHAGDEWAPCMPPDESDDPECLGVRPRVMRSKVRNDLLAAKKRVELAAGRAAHRRLKQLLGAEFGVMDSATASGAVPALVDSAERRVIRRLLAAALPGGEVEFWGLVEQEVERE